RVPRRSPMKRLFPTLVAACLLAAACPPSSAAPKTPATPATRKAAPRPRVAASATPTWAEPGVNALAAPKERAPGPPAAPEAREAWAEIAMLEDTRATDISRLVAMLQSRPDPLVRWRACRALARLQDTTAVGVLLDAVERDSSALVREEAAFAL